MASPLLRPHSHVVAAAALHSVRRADRHGRCPATVHQLGRFHDHGCSRSGRSKRSGSVKVSAFPSLDVVPLMVTMVEHVDMSRDYVVTKSIWHLSDAALKSVYTFYAMFTVWGVCFFASMKDPFYDSDTYRSAGGDGTVHWYYDRQEDLEASAREELLREELLEEIEQRVGGLRELEEVVTK
ncbi:photosynthetic NDH subunit of subcomplex B 4, chloroplastic-like isoform X1 [Miscanthus floridulus]|uniref:photosynthetic NDH subunit of subcomplex B 4, chloroplastic-like isoform X1 n=1 Tax=Miscanthus floridulus TaxID=154761 RepID=UPI00345A2740